ncbi:MAG: DUF934 domain-containing protein [Pseudomonadota bacterium]
MLLDRTGEIADPWRLITDPPAEGGIADLALEGPCLLPFAWIGAVKHAPLGAHLPNDTEPAAVGPHFPALDLISIEFPSFADGRGFSIAARLRDLGFRGLLRAHGPLIADQFAYLLECGFDQVWLPPMVAERQPAEMWLAQLGSVTLGYQRGREGRASILEQRLGKKPLACA